MTKVLSLLFALCAVIFSGLPAHAQCASGQLANCPDAVSPLPTDVLYGWQYQQNPHSRKFTVGQVAAGAIPVINAASYGVVGDGATSNDQALGTALYACEQVGGQLWLPPGRILLTGASLTGNATRTLASCAIRGTLVQAGSDTSGSSLGTTILLTSTVVTPFNICANWSIDGVNFYWPNQNGNSVITYPPLLADAAGCPRTVNWAIRNSNIVNAYDVYTQSTAGSGDWWITNSTVFAVHRVFQIKSIGDTVHMSGLIFSPGAWIDMCGATCYNAINAGALQSAILEVLPGGNFSGTIGNSHAFDWRYVFLIDANASIGQSVFNLAVDGIGTILDASASGASWTAGTVMTGTANCGSVPAYPSAIGVTVNPCFNMGSNSTLRLTGFAVAQNNGDFIDISGGQIYLDHVLASTIGAADTGGGTTDYYAVNFTGSTGGSILSIQNSTLSGLPTNTHVHGIVAGSGALSVLNLNNNEIEYFNDPVTIAAPPFSTITNNLSVGTSGSYSIQISGTNAVTYSNNNWDIPLVPVVSNCGGSGISVSGNVNVGKIHTGSTGPLTSCQMDMPFVPRYKSCTIMLSQPITSWGGVSGTVPSWVFHFGSDMSNSDVYYQCGGAG